MAEIVSFGKWLQLRRRSLDLTQAELARRAGCAVGTLRNLESDDTRPSKQLADRLARVLGVAETDIDMVVAFARGVGPLPEASGVFRSPDQHRHASTSSPSLYLPAQLTRLVGRTDEVAALHELLSRPDVRLVTLTGSGGTGKTRVALEVVYQLAEAFADGVAFIDLSAITDPALVVATIAQNLGIAETHRIAQVLRSQSRLLLLDNFEQVIAATPNITELLLACPHVKVLVTSRIALGAVGEYEWPLSPLSLPDRTNLPPYQELEQYEAVRLFRERAQAVNPRFAITSANAEIIAEICYRLDGLPLALELAAARIKLFAPQALLLRLDRRLDFLTSGGRMRPTRQQTMRNAIDWSYDLLAPLEQRLFRRFSVFVDAGTLTAIEAVCVEQHEHDNAIIDLSTLTNHSLIRRLAPIEGSGEDLDPRFGMLETIREYALERLAADPDAARIRERHAHYFAGYAEQLAADWDTPLMNRAVVLQRNTHNNMRAALQWSIDCRESMVALRLAVALWGFWRSYGFTSEGRRWLGQALAIEPQPATAAAMMLRQRALYAAGWLASDQHDFETAHRLFEERAQLRKALGEATDEFDVLVNAARQARMEGHYQRSVGVLSDVVRQRGVPGEPVTIAGQSLELSFNELGQMYRELGLSLREQGDFERAAELFQDAVALAHSNGDQVGVALAMLGLADIARDHGDGAGVWHYAEPGLQTFREIQMEWGIGFNLNTLAIGAAYQGDFSTALVLIYEAAEHFRKLQAYASLVEVLLTQGKILRMQGDIDAAYQAVYESLDVGRNATPRIFVAACLEEMVVLSAHKGLVEQTAHLLGAADTIRAAMGAPVRPVDRHALEAARAGVLAQLGASAFEAALEAGKHQPLETVITGIIDPATFMQVSIPKAAIPHR